MIVASHFGLQLNRKLQDSIPPFRDNSQTSLFYSTLRALESLIPSPAEYPPYSHLRYSANGEKPTRFSADVKPRLYEIGRHGAVDISYDLELKPGEFKSIHAARPDLDDGKVRLPVETETIIWWTLAIIFVALCAMLISGEVANIVFHTKRFWFAVLGIPALVAVLVVCAMRDGAEGEPFMLTEGVSVWPTVGIYLLAISLCLYFYCNSSKLLKDKDKKLSEKFRLPRPETTPYPCGWLWWWIQRRYSKTDGKADRAQIEIKLTEKIRSLYIKAASSFFGARWFSIPTWHHKTEGETIGETDSETDIRPRLPNFGRSTEYAED